ncbi:protein MCM10 homolog isoform X2 [Phalaenopsis equestris]|uniref:protein MCM10 homolog isoform X2 n=1 Tax=Phalaenopsis equestris TaxID=78828 RepID=UPI0009E43A14|nr:protein MCM10 homolog isoform X2 [Phalaenopsis equestris]
MDAAGDDLDLLLSLGGDKVPETPPGSPASSHPQFHGYVSDDGSPRRPRASDMSVFREAVRDYLDSEPTVPKVHHSIKKSEGKTREVEIERFSGIKIRNQQVSPVELSNRFSDVRFVRMSAIRTLLSGDTLPGSWATVGVLTEKGEAKMSSSGKSYCIWKMGCLDETNASVFLFGDAYKMNYNERVGTVFALFNSNVRKDDAGKGFSLSLYSVSQILRIGTSADYGICKGKRKDGMACTMVINKNKMSYCKYHSSNASQNYTTARAELKGGNLKLAFRPQGEGVYIVNPQANQSNRATSVQQVKVMSVDGLRKVLRVNTSVCLFEGFLSKIFTADKITTNRHSQGIRFLNKLTVKTELKLPDKQTLKQKEIKAHSGKRPAVATKLPSNLALKNGTESKRKKAYQSSANMIELEVISSDEDR